MGKTSTNGDYKVMGSGIVQLSDEVLGIVSIFADDVDGKEFKAMLAAINSLKLKNAKRGKPKSEHGRQSLAAKIVKIPVVDFQRLTKVAPNRRHPSASTSASYVNVTVLRNSFSQNNFPPNRSAT